MNDLLGEGLTWLNGRRHDHLSRPVVYTRPGEASIQLRATPGETEVEALDGEGFPITAHMVDWLVRTSDLVIDGAAIQPRKGDRIVVGGVTYEVLPIGDHGCFRHTDVSRLTLRIHTKEVHP